MKYSNADMPLFSIITVCYNAGNLLVKTIESLKKQTYSDYEFIVIDGASKDIEIIHKYGPFISSWISEKDQGIYDAMNKGLKMASGRFVWFMNAGDEFYDKNTLSTVAALIDKDTDIVYGETMLADDNGIELGIRSEYTSKKLPAGLTVNDMKWGMVVCHQSFVPRRDVAPEYILNNLSADIDWVIGCIKNAKGRIVNANHILCRYLMGGISKKKHRQSLIDRYHISVRHFGLFTTWWFHLLIFGRAAFVRMFGPKKKVY